MDYDYMIYPKQFRTVKIPIERNYCFFLMPFSDNFNKIYGSIKEFLISKGYNCNRADELIMYKPVINKILMEILKAQYVIVDFTDCNPNVFYELGITHTFKDSQNVLLLKQKDTKVPFDITHLQYKEYNPENLFQLRGIIEEFITSNKYINDFHRSLQIRNIIGLIHDNQEDFLNYLQDNIDKHIISLITLILNEELDAVNKLDVEDMLSQYQIFLHKISDSRKTNLFPGVFRLYTELLISCSSYEIAEKCVSFFLENFFVQHNLSYNEIQDLQTNMAVLLAKKKKFLPTVLPWIIEYFKKSKSASIDLNRYKLEAFLITSTYEEVNSSIINALLSSDCHIREHLADIIGEKHLVNAKDTLHKQLAVEKNYYTAVSFIEALGKIGDTESLSYIEDWLEKHTNSIIQSKSFFVLRHTQNAIIQLDVTSDGKHRKNFIQKFGCYLTHDVPL